MTRLIFALALCWLAAAPAAAQDRAGFRLESRVAVETPVFSGPPTDGETFGLGRGMTLGFEGGYDIALSDRILIGPYATFEVSDLETCDGSDCISSQDNIAGGLHGGFLLGERTMLYAKVGYARLALDAHVRGRDMADAGGGWQAALGYEHAFANELYVRMEAGYADNGRIFAVDFQRYHSTLAAGMRF